MEKQFVKEIQYQGVTFRYSRSPSLRKGKEIHAHHEIIYYLDGGATLLAGGIHQALEKNTLIFVPKGSFHNLQIKDQERYTRLTVSFSDLPILQDVLPFLDRIRLIREQELLFPAEALIRELEAEQSPGQTLALYAAFLTLLSGISRSGESLSKTELLQEGDVVSRCMAYIDTHFHKDIHVADLAKAFFVSESFLFLEFKKALGISIYQYLTQRRMIYARKLLSEGKKPTEIYLQCGYADYSTFYKAYVKRFSQSPRGMQKTT